MVPPSHGASKLTGPDQPQNTCGLCYFVSSQSSCPMFAHSCQLKEVQSSNISSGVTEWCGFSFMSQRETDRVITSFVLTFPNECPALAPESAPLHMCRKRMCDPCYAKTSRLKKTSVLLCCLRTHSQALGERQRDRAHVMAYA
ncbi:unnamed protein product [Ectocarpus sp. 12 AP-2014]